MTDELVETTSLSGFVDLFSHRGESFSSVLAGRTASLESLGSAKRVTSLEALVLISEDDPPDGSKE